MDKNNLQMTSILFKTAIRNLLKGKWNTIVSILGLSIGLSVFILIFSLLRYEYSFNKHNKDFDQIFYAKLEVNDVGEIASYKYLPTAIAPLLRISFPEIAYASRNFVGGSVFELNGESILENVNYVDGDLFKIYTFNFLYGSAEEMDEEYKIVISRKKALKLFNKENCVGEVLKESGGQPCKVVGVFEDLPGNSDLQGDLYLSIESMLDKSAQIRSDDFSSGFTLTKVKTTTKVDLDKLNKKIEKVIAPHYGNTDRVKIVLYPFKDFHFYEMGSKQKTKIMMLYGAISIIILLLSAFNFVNIYTATAIQRRKSNALHQIMGSGRFKIAAFLLLEAIIISIIAYDIALLLCERGLAWFNSMMSVEIAKSFVFNWQFLLFTFIIAIVVGVLSALYPLRQVFRFSLSNALKGINKKGKSSFRLQKTLVGFQFMVTSVLIALILVVVAQMQFVKKMDLGYEPEGVISGMFHGGFVVKKLDVLKDKLRGIPGVAGVSCCSRIPFRGMSGVSVGKKDGDIYFKHHVYDVDKDFFDVFGAKLIQGKGFEDCPVSSSENYCVLNETAVRQLGLEDPINAMVEFKSDYAMRVVGVVKDFYPQTVTNPIPPVILVMMNEQRQGYISWVNILYNGANKQETAEKATSVIRSLFPNSPYEFKVFTREELDASTYARLGNMEMTYSFFGLIGLLLGLVGVYGLIALNMKIRVKEIGVRKVLGASNKAVFVLIASDYMKMVLIGGILSWPIAYVLANRFLDDYSKHISLNPFYFILPLVLIAALTLITISYHSYRAATSNPVDSLRSE